MTAEAEEGEEQGNSEDHEGVAGDLEGVAGELEGVAGERQDKEAASEVAHNWPAETAKQYKR